MKKLLINRPTKIIVGLCVFYLLFGYFAVNPIAQKIIPWVVEKKLASQAAVGKVTFDPLRLKTTIDNFSLNKKDGTPLAGFEKLVVDFELSGLFDWAWKFKDISITKPQANIAISSKGALNWSDLITKLNEDKTPPSDSIPRVEINHIAIIKGGVKYLDENRPVAFKAELSPLDLELDNFSTLPKDRGNYLIAAKIPDQGGTLKWKGNLGVNPIASKGSLAIDNISLAKMMRIVKGNTLPFKATNGNINAGFTYDFALLNDKPKITLNNVVLGVNNLAGSVLSVGNVGLQQAALTASSLDFSMQNVPKLQFQTIALKLDALTLLKSSNTSLSLKQTTVELPKLDIAIEKQTQVQFQDLNLKLTDLNLSNDKNTLLTLPQLEAKQVGFDLSERQAKIAQVTLPNGAIKAIRNKDGIVNWQQALFAPDTLVADNSPVKESTASSESAPFNVDIANVQLEHWRMAFQDNSFTHPLQANIADFNLGFTVASPSGNLQIGKLHSEANGISAKSTLYGAPIASLRSATLNQGQLDISNKKINAESIVLSGLKTELKKEVSKPFNWQSILETVPSALNQNSTKSKASSKKSEWDVSVNKMALIDSSVHIEDQSLAKPFVLNIEKAMLELRDTSINLERPIPVKAALQIKEGGKLSLQGRLTPSPLKADLNLNLAGLSLKPLAPYVSQFALLKLSDGSADIAGKIAIQDNKTLALIFNGGFSVNNLALLEDANDAPFLGWQRVSSDNLEVSLGPNHVRISELQIVKPTGKFIIHEDKSLNITRILRNQTNNNAPNSNADIPPPVSKPVETAISNPQTAATKAAVETEVTNNADSTPATSPINIDTVRIDNAELDFADLSLKPQFGTHINSLSGVINGVSTDVASVAQVELDGKVDDYGSARVRGSVQPFKATNFTDLKLSFKNLEMNRLTPYSGKFAGRRIDAGKLSVDLEYKIKQRQLAGENKFIINKLKLGEKIDSAEAANLPLDLAIAILEDSDGVIDLDLPISGSLDDPKFSYGSIVWKAIRNVLSKIATAPFRALGKLFGSGADKLEAISFDAGSSNLAPPEQEKLKTVSQALAKRPGLTLGISPSYETALDTRAMQENILRLKVAQEMGLKLAEGQQPGPIDISNPKTQSVIDDLYDTLTKKSLIKKLASKLEKPKEGHYQEALEKLTISVEVSDTDLQTLAKSRGEAILKSLLVAGISKDKVRIDNVIKLGTGDKAINTKLTLDVKAASPKAATPDLPSV